MRKYVVLKFMDENPGQGTGELATRYKYIVERFEDHRTLYLLRPARFKLGFDFQIWIDYWNNFGTKMMPSYTDLIDDLKKKEKENPDFFRFLLNGIQKLFICEDDDRILNWLNKNKIVFKNGENLIVLLKVIKWMFIEQDIRYWNFSGRKKLMLFINDNFKNDEI